MATRNTEGRWPEWIDAVLSVRRNRGYRHSPTLRHALLAMQQAGMDVDAAIDAVMAAIKADEATPQT